MQSFLLRRLSPFFVFTLAVELGFFAFMMFTERSVVDSSAGALVKTLGVLLLTTTVSFIYMMMPYVLYLLFLPAGKVNSRFDKITTTAIFSFYVYLTLFEETASMIFWEEFSSAFNFIAVDYLVYTHEVVSNIYQSYPIIWFLLGILTATAAIVFFGRRYLFTDLPAPRFGRRLFHTAIMAALAGLSFVNVDIANLEISQNRFNNELSKEGTYSLFSAFLKNELSYQDFYLTKEKADNLSLLQRQLAAPHTDFIAPKENIRREIFAPGKMRKLNVVIVLMESMSAEFLDENRPKGSKIITPNLSKLSRESLFFPNTYATGTRSVRGIEALTLSVPPLPGMSIVRRPHNEGLRTIGTVFKEKGYDNKWIYGGYGYFDNMNHFFENNGFQAVDRTTWEKGEVSFANAWGAADEDTFAKVIKEADESYAEGKPFFSILLTISNHRPYTYPDGRIDLPSKIARREGGVKYADYAIGKFIEDAKTKPWFDDTVFVFVADHTAGAAGSEELSLKDHHIPMMFYAPKVIQPRRIETPVSQIDALPTLLGILNFSYESRFFGQDALSRNYQSRFFISNYQKLGYVKNGVEVILKPIKQVSVSPKRSPFAAKYTDEAIAYYQQCAEWQTDLKAKP